MCTFKLFTFFLEFIFRNLSVSCKLLLDVEDVGKSQMQYITQKHICTRAELQLTMPHLWTSQIQKL